MKNTTISKILSLMAAAVMTFTLAPAILPDQPEIPSTSVENQQNENQTPKKQGRALLDNKDNA